MADLEKLCAAILTCLQIYFRVQLDRFNNTALQF